MTTQELITLIETNLPDNVLGEITEAKIREVCSSLANQIKCARFTVDPAYFSGPNIELLAALSNGNYRQILGISVSTYNEGGVLNPNGITTFDITMGDIIAQIPISILMFDPSLYSRQLALNFSNLQNLASAIEINSNNTYSTIGGFSALYIDITYREVKISDY